MLILNVLYTTKPGCREQFVRALEDSGTADRIRQEKGCICYDYYLAAGAEDRVLLLEKWESPDLQAAHMLQPHMAQLAEIKDRYVLSAEVVKLSEQGKLFRERRSCRNFRPEQVPKALLDQIAEAGIWAASGCNEQTTVIIAVTDPVMREKLRAANAAVMGNPEADPFYGAPDIFVVADRANTSTPVYNGSLALGNMMLRAWELGLGCCWVHRAREEFEGSFGKELLKSVGLEGEYIGVGHLIVGFPKEKPADRPRAAGRYFTV